MPGWSERVRIVAGDEGYAYVPGEILVRRADLGDALRLLGRQVADPVPDDSKRETRPVVLRYRGDVPSAIRRLRGAGLVVQPNHVFFATASDGIQGNPVYGNPVYGNPVYGNPVYGNPVYGNPVYGNPVYGNPVYGNPVYGNPVYGNEGRAPGGCSHCDDRDRCECVAATGSSSTVFPNPVYAPKFFPAGIARAYQQTGLRPTTATPAYVDADASALPNAPWSSAAVRVAVIDTGWPAAPGPKAPAPWGWTASIEGGHEHDRPDTGADADVRIDPAAGHGMFIAGIVAQYAPGTSVQVFRALGPQGDGDELAIADLIHDLATANEPPHLMNLSFGAYTLEAPKVLQDAVEFAQRQGIVVVASAGNDGTSRPIYPAAFPGVVSVGALGPDGPAPFSNWGSWVRACAPGVDIVSGFWCYDSRDADPSAEPVEDFDGWAAWSGTSFAAPIVVAALAREIQLGATPGDAVARVIDHPALFRFPCHGTVVNPGSGLPV